MPSPKPASSWGSSVHSADASGRNARPAIPPATSTQPASARAPGGPLTNEPATAASGSIVTAAAAASGATLQPLISISTSRKITAVSAPDSRASAAADSTSRGGRGSASRTAAIGLAASAGAAASAIGAWATKIARQSNSSVRMPPSAGPAAVPATAAPTQSLRPAPPPSRASKAAASSAEAPTAWSARMTSSSSSEFALAQPIDAAANRSAPAAPVARLCNAADSGSASVSTNV